MYKECKLSSYEQDKLAAYTNAALSRFELSRSFKLAKINNARFIHTLSCVVNDMPELKRAVINGVAIEYHKLNPAYVLEKDGEIVSTYTEFCDDLGEFLQNYEKDYALLNNELKFCLKTAPINCFYISSFKGYFDSFSLHLKHGFEFYQPIFTTFKRDDEFIIYANFHHAFFDLARAKSFYDRLEKDIKNANF